MRQDIRGTEQAESVCCRLLREEETAQVKALWSTCFADQTAFVDWYFAQYYRAARTLGIFADDRLLASAQMIPYRLRLRGAEADAAYIVGVDTAPAARHRGYARRLLAASLAAARARGQSVSLLMPFEGQFYYRYGWAFCYFHQRICTSPQELRCAARPWGEIRQTPIREALPEMERIYARFAAHYHGAVCRTPQHWQDLASDWELDHAICFLSRVEGATRGYCVWVALKGKILIQELAWETPEVKAGFLEFLQRSVPPEQRLWLELPEDDSLVFRLAADKEAAVRYPFLMARIVDVASCLSVLRYPPDVREELRLAVRDPFAEWNDGVFLLRVADGAAEVRKLPRDAPADASLSIDALTQLVFGACGAGWLSREGSLAASPGAVARLVRIWPQENNYINEYY